MFSSSGTDYKRHLFQSEPHPKKLKSNVNMSGGAERSRRISRDETAENDGPPLDVHVAVMENNLKTLQELIQSGAPQLHQKTYETALHVAARTPALECLQWLLDNYINSPLDTDCNGSTPCHYAVVYGNLEALKASEYCNILRM